MPNIKKSEQLILLFLALLTTVNLIQSYTTQLIFDEAYYWYFAQNLDWGYFDHPPAVAFLVKMGTLLFNGELGVRFFASFLFSGTIYLIWKLIDTPKKHEYAGLFCIFISSVALFNVYGFYMLPDTPLVFAAALFLYAYKNFVNHDNFKNIVLLALSMALMMYSKYHAFLLITFVFLSNIKILLNPRFWYAVIFSLIFYTPHLIWLYQYDFAPLKYHFLDRVNSYYKFDYTTKYILDLLVILGFSFPWAYYAFFKTKTKDTFDKGLKTAAWGIIIFFFISSFSRRTQAQWPILILFPLIIFSFRYAIEHAKFRKGLYISSIISVVVILYLRFAMVHEKMIPFTYETHGNKEWVQKLKESSGGLPIVFKNSYRNASMYSFYSGVDSYSLNGLGFRLNQYDLDTTELRFQNKKVAYVSEHKMENSCFSVVKRFRNDTLRGKKINNFKSYRKLKIHTAAKNFNELINTSTILVGNPYTETIPAEHLKFYIAVLNSKKNIIDTLGVALQHDTNMLPPKSETEIKIKAITRKPFSGDATYFRFTISEFGLPYGFQGETISIK